MRYLPLTEADRRSMLATIGVPSVDSLFRDVPESARLEAPIDGLAPHAGEMEVERTIAAMAAKNSDFIQYANGNIASKPLLSAAVRDNPGIYPPDAVMARLYTITPYDQKSQRLVNRLWTRVKTGK